MVVAMVCIGQDLDHAAAQAELEGCLLTEEEMKGGSESWFALPDPFYEAWETQQRKAEPPLEQLTQSVTHVLILHKSDTVPLQAAVSVMASAGIAAIFSATPMT